VSSVDTSGAASGGLRPSAHPTSKRSGRQTGFFMMDPFQRYTPADLAESGIPLVSSSKVVQESLHRQAARGSSNCKPPYAYHRHGDGDFMKDEFLGSRGNLTLFANIIDYLADDAVSLRSVPRTWPPRPSILF